MRDGMIVYREQIHEVGRVGYRLSWSMERLAEGLQYTVQLLLDDIRELRKKIHDEACNSAAKLSNPKKRR